MKIFYLISFMTLLSLIKINSDILNINTNIDTQFYDCTLNQITHRQNKKCKGETIEKWKLTAYKKCGVDGLHYNIYSSNTDCFIPY